jgi:radical SAM protein with 4Fe4S-binding SPASM domain
MKSTVGVGAVVKQFIRFVPYPWIATRLVTLGLEKQFFGLLHPKAGNGEGGKIRQASFRITDLCNLRCHTCGQWGDRGFLHDKNLKELKKQEVAPERYLELFADLVKHGHHPLVYYWGGEPMLYSGILDVIEGAAAMGLPPSIATNGTRIASSADRLVRAPLFLLQISIDGHNAETHNRSRPAAGGGDNFQDIQDGLDAVIEARKIQGSKLPVIASLTTINRNNFRNLSEIYQAFQDKVDLFVFYPSWWIDTEDAKAHEQDFYNRFGFLPIKHWGWVGDWRPDDYQALDDQLKQLVALSKPLNSPPVALIPPIMGVENLQDYYSNHRATFGYNRCISIYHAVEVNSNGDMSPCRDYHDYVVGNLKDSTITELWESPAYRKFRQSLSSEGLMPVCTRCCGLMGY